MAAVLCPVSFMITDWCTPAFLMLVLKVCRRSWNRKSPIPALTQAFKKAVLIPLTRRPLLSKHMVMPKSSNLLSLKHDIQELA